MSRAALSIAVIATAAAVVNARPAYVARIPNGDEVNDVDALGHVNPEGGGPNNAFGTDFKAAGEVWSPEFCQLDSDGDGQTNGQELGDPCCEWVQNTNAVTRWSDDVSHPGDATSTSNPSLWASITCPNASSSTSSTSATSRNGTSSTVASDSAYGASPATSSNVSGTSTPAPSTESSGSPSINAGPAILSAVGVAATIAAFFM